jgi:RNA polymerase sigma-70 factor (ECF subfamily)
MIDAFPEVLAAAQIGDPAALTTLYRALNPGVERYLRGRAPGAEEDLAADTWISVAGSIQRFSGGEEDFRSWVFTIARNRVIDAHRREQRRPVEAQIVDPDDAGADPAYGAVDPAETAALAALDTETVLAIVRRLPPDQADVIMLRVVAGLDTDRVAKVLGKRPGAIRVLQHRGLRNLERLLGDSSRGMDTQP